MIVYITIWRHPEIFFDVQLNMLHEVNGFLKVLIVDVHLQHLLCMFLLGIIQFLQQVAISSHQRPTRT